MVKRYRFNRKFCTSKYTVHRTLFRFGKKFRSSSPKQNKKQIHINNEYLFGDLTVNPTTKIIPLPSGVLLSVVYHHLPAGVFYCFHTDIHLLLEGSSTETCRETYGPCRPQERWAPQGTVGSTFGEGVVLVGPI